MYSWHAEEDDELTIEKDEVIENVKDSGWWQGEINGKRGFFPKNYVELLRHEESGKSKNKGCFRKGKYRIKQL